MEIGGSAGAEASAARPASWWRGGGGEGGKLGSTGGGRGARWHGRGEGRNFRAGGKTSITLKEKGPRSPTLSGRSPS